MDNPCAETGGPSFSCPRLVHALQGGLLGISHRRSGGEIDMIDADELRGRLTIV